VLYLIVNLEKGMADPQPQRIERERGRRKTLKGREQRIAEVREGVLRDRLDRDLRWSKMRGRQGKKISNLRNYHFLRELGAEASKIVKPFNWAFEKGCGRIENLNSCLGSERLAKIEGRVTIQVREGNSKDLCVKQVSGG